MSTFNKKEKLCSIVEINNLFKRGKGFVLYPFSVRFSIKRNDNPKVLLILSSPKKYHKLAVERNRIKRLLREAYRINKEDIVSLAKENNLEILLSISFICKDMPNFEAVNSRMRLLLSRIICREYKNEF